MARHTWSCTRRLSLRPNPSATSLPAGGPSRCTKRTTAVAAPESCAGDTAGHDAGPQRDRPDGGSPYLPTLPAESRPPARGRPGKACCWLKSASEKQFEANVMLARVQRACGVLLL